MNKLITGTVRARQGDRHLVVTRSGERMLVRLEGSEVPRLGVDLVGVLGEDDDGPVLELVPDVTRMLLQGKARIIPIGRPDVTARIIARLLMGAGPAAIRPGVGGTIERTPQIDDPDIKWALDILEPEARRAGVAFNVIDPIAMASSTWDDARLTEEVLPADVSGDTSALADLKRLLNDGMTPACRRTIEAIGRGVATPSVDFVLPYSPFATGFSWCADISQAARNELVAISIPGSDARRLSTFRELALAFAPRYLGRTKAEAGCEGHVEAAFVDVAAALALLRYSDRPLSPLRFQRLREAALARWDGHGSCPPATAAALGAVAALGMSLGADTPDELFRTAASIARNNAPTTLKQLEEQRAAATARGVFIDLETAPPPFRTAVLELYRKDLQETASRLSGSERALGRMSKFGIYTVPLGLETAFDEVVRADPESYTDEPIAFPADPWAADADQPEAPTFSGK